MFTRCVWLSSVVLAFGLATPAVAEKLAIAEGDYQLEFKLPGKTITEPVRIVLDGQSGVKITLKNNPKAAPLKGGVAGDSDAFIAVGLAPNVMTSLKGKVTAEDQAEGDVKIMGINGKQEGTFRLTRVKK